MTEYYNFRNDLPHDNHCKKVIAVMPDGTEKNFPSLKKCATALGLKYHRVVLAMKHDVPLEGITFKKVEE